MLRSVVGFAQVCLQRLPDLPQPVLELYAWVEDHDLVVTSRRGELIVTLGEGSSIELRVSTEEEAAHFQSAWGVRGEAGRLRPIAQTGGDGSTAALWTDDDGVVRVVHLGSGSGSTMTCVLADDPVDFLRLLAIGYDEVCWPEHFHEPPETAGNPDLRRWVETRFGVTVPATAAELPFTPVGRDVEDSADPFLRWLTENGAFEQ